MCLTLLRLALSPQGVLRRLASIVARRRSFLAPSTPCFARARRQKQHSVVFSSLTRNPLQKSTCENKCFSFLPQARTSGYVGARCRSIGGTADVVQIINSSPVLMKTNGADAVLKNVSLFRFLCRLGDLFYKRIPIFARGHRIYCKKGSVKASYASKACGICDLGE